MSNVLIVPTIPTQYQVYNSYVEDPKWARKFTAIWAVGFALLVGLSLPLTLKAIRRRKTLTGLFGIVEDVNGKGYVPLQAEAKGSERIRNELGVRTSARGLASAFKFVARTLWWTIPLIELSVGQILLIFAYLIAVVCCITLNVDLTSYPNRAGFLALAQLPPTFLFALKSPFPLSLLLGPSQSYQTLNYLHRSAGRGLFLGAVIHGSLWIRNHLQYGLQIIGSEKETSGIATFGVLCVIVLTSLRPVRRWGYQFFYAVHVLGYVSFFITLCYHTPYAKPWIYPPIAFYAFDFLMRMLRVRVKDATLIPVGDHMTLIQIHDVDQGWRAGQHLRLRVFFGDRIFESHPLTICTATPSLTVTNFLAPSNSLLLGARVSGDWSKALNEHAKSLLALQPPSKSNFLSSEKSQNTPQYQIGISAQVMLTGPYGGLSIDLVDYENVLMVAGGSGATFTLGALDELIGRMRQGVEGEVRTRRVEWVWCVRSFGHITWFAPLLHSVSTAASSLSLTLSLHISIYVTCLCDPSAIPSIPNMDVVVHDGRPRVGRLVEQFVEEGSENEKEVEGDKGGFREGGLGICASGPESLTREARNAAARLGRGCGEVGLHTEVFAL